MSPLRGSWGELGDQFLDAGPKLAGSVRGDMSMATHGAHRVRLVRGSGFVSSIGECVRPRRRIHELRRQRTDRADPRRAPVVPKSERARVLLSGPAG